MSIFRQSRGGLPPLARDDDRQFFVEPLACVFLPEDGDVVHREVLRAGWGADGRRRRIDIHGERPVLARRLLRDECGS